MNKELKIYNRILKKDLINKYLYKKESKIPNLQSITLHIGCKTQDIKTIARSVLALEMISGVRARLTTSKKQNLFLKTKKNSTSGAVVRLKKSNMVAFYFYLAHEVFPKIKKTEFNFPASDGKSLTWTINRLDFSGFEEIDFNSNVLKELPDLNISFEFNKKLSFQEKKLLLLLLQS